MWTKGIDTLRFFLTMKEIKSIKLSGAGSLKAPAIRTDDFELVNSGAGTQAIEKLDTQHIDSCIKRSRQHRRGRENRQAGYQTIRRRQL